MDSTFTLPYSEYAVIDGLSHHFKKKQHLTFYIPASRQEKDVDFVLRNSKSGKFLSFQVKASRAHTGEDEQGTKHVFWFSNFIEKVKQGTADYYILFGVYPVYTTKNKISSKRGHSRTMTLCLNQKEMVRFLNGVRLKKEKRADKFFYIYTYGDGVFLGGRGFKNYPTLNRHLVESKVAQILKAIS